MTSSISNKHGPVRRSFRNGGFTLIELLTVIVIIAILIALLFPAVKTVLLKAETNQAKGDVKAVETAIKSYYNEYGKLPTQDADQGSTQPDKIYSNSTNAADIYNTLRAVASGWNASDALNPRRIVFLETPARKGAFDSDGNFVDPWNSTYRLVFDCNYDGTAAAGGFTNAGTALVISLGPDRVSTNSTSRADDILSYQ